MQFYTYVHRRQDDNLIFYVGKGQKRRAWSKKGRNKHWHNTVKKHGYVVEIWNYFLSEKDAFEDEMKLISNMPDCMKLTNLTLGGEGMSGYKYTEQQREKKRQISLGANNPHYGKKHPPELIEYMREVKRGQNNPMFGFTGARNPNAKTTTMLFENGDTRTFPTIKDAAEFLGIHFSDVSKYKKGVRKMPKKYGIKEIS